MLQRPDLREGGRSGRRGGVWRGSHLLFQRGDGVTHLARLSQRHSAGGRGVRAAPGAAGVEGVPGGCFRLAPLLAWRHCEQAAPAATARVSHCRVKAGQGRQWCLWGGAAWGRRRAVVSSLISTRFSTSTLTHTTALIHACKRELGTRADVLSLVLCSALPLFHDAGGQLQRPLGVSRRGPGRRPSFADDLSSVLACHFFAFAPVLALGTTTTSGCHLPMPGHLTRSRLHAVRSKEFLRNAL